MKQTNVHGWLARLVLRAPPVCFSEGFEGIVGIDGAEEAAIEAVKVFGGGFVFRSSRFVSYCGGYARRIITAGATISC